MLWVRSDFASGSIRHTGEKVLKRFKLVES